MRGLPLSTEVSLREYLTSGRKIVHNEK